MPIDNTVPADPSESVALPVALPGNLPCHLPVDLPVDWDAERAQGRAALALLYRIRYHAQRHALPREWLTAADEVLGTWGPVKVNHPEVLVVASGSG